MSEEDEDFIEDENKKEDEELMQNLIQSIEALKQENPPTPPESPSVSPVLEEPKESISTQPTEPVDLDNLSLGELRVLLDQVNQARDYNNQLQGILLMKEVKLLSIKRHISASKSEARRCKQKEEQRTDVGRYYVKFKAPYFKSVHNFAGYVIVPDSKLPVTAQRYETPAGQWNKAALKDLEANVRLFLTTRKLKDSMKMNKPKTLREKETLISQYHYMRKQAPISTLVDSDFDNTIDWCSVASKMRKDFSPNECQKAWNIFLRPDINKKKWTVAERENLKRVALEHNYEDWDAIAWELGTNRNGYQCFHLYVDKIMKLVEGDWSVAEEDFLTKLVKECTYGEKVMWHKVAYFFETRTITQIYRKWTLSCVGKEVVAGAFTEEEDKTIMDMLIVNKGRFSINQVAKKLNRISSQIRYRFAQLKSSLKHKYGEWSLEEDKQLLDLVEKFGKKSWSKIAEHMPDRGRVQIRHRYTNLRKRLAANPDLSLESLTRFKRPVHSKRKETNIKCLMALSGIEEPPSDGNTNEGDDTTVQAVEQIIGPDSKKRRRHPTDPQPDLIPSRYPDLEEDAGDNETPVSADLGIPNIPMSSEQPERDPLKSPEKPAKQLGNKSPRSSTNVASSAEQPDQDPLRPPVKKRGNRSRPSKPSRRNSAPKSEPRRVSESEEEEPVPEPEPKPRPAELFGPIMEYYTTTSDFCGELAKPPASQSGRKPQKAETLNSVMKFTPYKYFDPNNADWTYDADRTDPYYSEVFKMIEKKSDTDDDDTDDDEKLKDDRLLPPCLTNFEGFYNLLVDMGLTEEDLEASDDKLDKRLEKLYCQDEETIAAVGRWNKRFASLFAWPAALSGVSLVMDDPNGDDDVRPSTSRGRPKTKPKRQSAVKPEPLCDDECSRLSNLDLTDK